MKKLFQEYKKTRGASKVMPLFVKHFRKDKSNYLNKPLFEL